MNSQKKKKKENDRYMARGTLPKVSINNWIIFLYNQAHLHTHKHAHVQHTSLALQREPIYTYCTEPPTTTSHLSLCLAMPLFLSPFTHIDTNTHTHTETRTHKHRHAKHPDTIHHPATHTEGEDTSLIAPRKLT